MATRRNRRPVLILISAFLVLTALSGAHSPQDAGAPEADHLIDMHRHPFFWDVIAASVVGWVIGLVRGFDTSKNWLGRYWPRPPLLLIFTLDMLIFVVVGGYFGTGIYDPAGFLEAMAAGLSWPVGLGALATSGREENDAT